MRAVSFGVVFALGASAGALAAQTPQPAGQILASAQTAAAGQHKTIFLIFHASW